MYQYQILFFSETTLNLTDLKPYTTYGYNLTTYGLEVTKGDYMKGNFSTTMYTTGEFKISLIKRLVLSMSDSYLSIL